MTLLGLSDAQKNLYYLLSSVGPISYIDIMRLSLIAQSEWQDNQYYFGRNEHVPYSRELIYDLQKLELQNLISYKQNLGMWEVNDQLSVLHTPEKYLSFAKIQNFARHNHKTYALELSSFFKLELLEKGEKVPPQKGFIQKILSLSL